MPWAIVLAAALVTALGGVVAAHLRRRTPAEGRAEREESSATSQVAVAPTPVEQLEGEIEALRAQLQLSSEEAGRADGLRGELEATREAVAQRLAALEQDLQEVRSRLVERDAELESERSARRLAEEALAEQGSPASVPVVESDADPLPIEATAPRSDPEPLAPGQEQTLRQAAGFDRLLSEIESGQAARARARLEGLVAEGLLSSDGASVTALLAGLVAGWEALERAGVAGTSGTSGLDAHALSEAEAGLELAREHRPGFAEEASGWLGFGETDGSPQHRLERLDRTVDGLEQRLGSALAELELEHAREWEWILELGLGQDPAHGARHVARFACEHDRELTQLCAAALLSACVREGDVDPEALARAQHLEAWGRLALERPVRERSAADLDLIWLWYARRWYVDGDGYDVLDWDGLEMPQVHELSEDWRAELRLETQLSQPGSGWPPASGRRSVYLVRAQTPARWRIDERGVESAGADPVRLIRSHLDAGGAALGGAVEVELQNEGRSFRYAGSGGVLVDLAAWGVTAAVSPCPEPPREDPPAGCGATVQQASDLRKQLAGAIALVYRDGDWTRWFVPGVGLVREERAGSEGDVVIQLVAQAPLR